MWAHPDDETFVAGGLLAAAARGGARVRCVYLTHGDGGQCAHGPVSRAELAALRAKELIAAHRHLGVAERRLLDHPDGHLAELPDDDPIDTIRAELAATVPDLVVTFGPDGFTGHPDHRTVNRWVHAALSRHDGMPIVWETAVTDAWAERFAPPLAEFEAFWPGYPQPTPSDRLVDRSLRRDDLDAKVSALHAHASQMTPLFDAFGGDLMRSLAATEAFVPCLDMAVSAPVWEPVAAC
ncbi:MAG: PIG-L deacetylase family protein [Nitriliruptoraceae bacterium]